MGVSLSYMFKWNIVVLLSLLLFGACNTLAQEGLTIEMAFEPKTVKVKDLILPEDIVSFKVRVRAVEFADDIVVLVYEIICVNELTEIVIRRGDVSVVLVGGEGLAIFNIEIPWCKSLMVKVTPMKFPNVSSSLVVNVYPEVRLSLVEPREPFLGEKREGGHIIARILLRTNIEGGYGLLIVRDETLGLTLQERRVELSDNRVHDLYIRIPENPTRLLVFKEWSMLHKIAIVYEGPDSYPHNNLVNLYVIAVAGDIWRIPWAASVAIGFIVSLIILAYVTKRLYS